MKKLEVKRKEVRLMFVQSKHQQKMYARRA